MSVLFSTRIPAMIAGSELKASQILRKGALDILSDSHNRVKVVTGHLQSTGNVVTVDPLHVEVRYDANYALWVEEGTRNQRAQPYLRPAFDAVVPAIEAAFKAML